MQWSNELTDELFKPSRKKFKRRRVISLFVDHIWATDLLDLQRYARVNKGYRYILVVVDVFSKYAWLRALKTKKGNEVSSALKDIIKNSSSPPKFLWSDRGFEYLNTFVKKLLKHYGIHHYFTYNTEKCVIAERFNRTIRTWLEKYFETSRHTVWYNILSDLEKRYNNSKHRSIGLTPIQARLDENYMSVLNKLNFPDKRNDIVASFKIGDRVRISTNKDIFEKKTATKNWSKEVFVVDAIKKTVPLTYILKDLNGEIIEGSFYKEELQKTKIKNDLHRVEKILDRKTVNGIKMVKVKWDGYNSSFNSWIPEKDVVTEG